MTIGYVAESYDVAFITLTGRLQLSPDTDPKSTLKDLADRTSLPPYRIHSSTSPAFAVADTAPIQKSSASSGGLSTLNDSILLTDFDIRIRGLRYDPVTRRIGASIAKWGSGHDRGIAASAHGKA